MKWVCSAKIIDVYLLHFKRHGVSSLKWVPTKNEFVIYAIDKDIYLAFERKIPFVCINNKNLHQKEISPQSEGNNGNNGEINSEVVAVEEKDIICPSFETSVELLSCLQKQKKVLMHLVFSFNDQNHFQIDREYIPEVDFILNKKKKKTKKTTKETKKAKKSKKDSNSITKPILKEEKKETKDVENENEKEIEIEKQNEAKDKKEDSEEEGEIKSTTPQKKSKSKPKSIVKPLESKDLTLLTNVKILSLFQQFSNHIQDQQPNIRFYWPVQLSIILQRMIILSPFIKLSIIYETPINNNVNNNQNNNQNNNNLNNNNQNKNNQNNNNLNNNNQNNLLLQITSSSYLHSGNNMTVSIPIDSNIQFPTLKASTPFCSISPNTIKDSTTSWTTSWIPIKILLFLINGPYKCDFFDVYFYGKDYLSIVMYIIDNSRSKIFSTNFTAHVFAFQSCSPSFLSLINS
jgi:hypothetical protein